MPNHAPFKKSDTPPYMYSTLGPRTMPCDSTHECPKSCTYRMANNPGKSHTRPFLITFTSAKVHIFGQKWSLWGTRLYLKAEYHNWRTHYLAFEWAPWCNSVSVYCFVHALLQLIIKDNHKRKTRLKFKTYHDNSSNRIYFYLVIRKDFRLKLNRWRWGGVMHPIW